MDKFIKIQSNQSEFSSTANLVDFVIPEGSGVYNPAQHKKMKKGKVKQVMVEQKTKGNR